MEKPINDLNISELNSTNIFSTDKILNRLNDKSVNLIAVDRLSSTNTVLKTNSDVLPDKTILLADSQTAGRGRLNKSFYSPDGTGIYMSVLIKKKYSQENALLITALVAVAVLKVIQQYVSDAKIKWVNDIYIGDKKVCGILTESSFNVDSKLTDYIVIGIGLNVYTPYNSFPAEISDIATCLFDKKTEFDINLIVSELLNSVFSYLSDFNIKQIIEEYSTNSYLDGKTVKVIEFNNCYDAVVLGVDEKLRLKVKTKDGEVVTLSSGEVSTIPNRNEK